jgi:hypothetical protein
MLQLCLQHGFYNIIFKIKHKFYIASKEDVKRSDHFEYIRRRWEHVSKVNFPGAARLRVDEIYLAQDYG